MFMKRSLTQRLKSWARVAFAVLWVPFGAELYLRCFHQVPVVPRYVTAGSFGIRVNEPNRTYWHSSADYHIQIRTNSKGIRSDREIPYEKPPGVQRIVVLGDSFGMGYEVSLEDSFTVRMEQALRKHGVNAEVVNLSVSGYGNSEELMMLQNEGLKYHPDLVLLCWNSTDLDDNVRSALFVLDHERLKTANTQYLPGVATQQRLYRIPGYEWIAANSDLYSFVREWVSWHIVKKVLVAMAETNESPAAAAPAGTDDYPARLTVSLLREIQSMSTQAGARFIVFDIPDRSGNHRFASSLPAEASNPSFDMAIYNPIADFAKRIEQPLYWSRSQGHFTPYGCQIVGNGLAEYILVHHLLQVDEHATRGLAHLQND
jgi:hypothetical protein